GPPPALPVPTDTNRRDCGRVAADRGSVPSPGDSASGARLRLPPQIRSLNNPPECALQRIIDLHCRRGKPQIASDVDHGSNCYNRPMGRKGIAVGRKGIAATLRIVGPVSLLVCVGLQARAADSLVQVRFGDRSSPTTVEGKL